MLYNVKGVEKNMKIEYIMIPFGMFVLVAEGLLGFTLWVLCDIPKNIITFLIDNEIVVRLHPRT
jgi:hypothetical protein